MHVYAPDPVRADRRELKEAPIRELLSDRNLPRDTPPVDRFVTDPLTLRQNPCDIEMV